MAIFTCRTSMTIILLLFYLLSSEIDLPARVGALGINYGQLGNNLPAPDKVASLLTSLRITKARIYDTNPQILTAFSHSNIELIVTVPNEMMATLMDPTQAFQWVSTNIKPYYPATNITGIAVGNEIFTSDDATQIASLIPCMVSIYEALAQLGLQSYIKVSTANSLAVLANSYPPSAGSFKDELDTVMSQLLHFLYNTGAPFWINAYPYFAYKDNPTRIPLNYVLFNANNSSSSLSALSTSSPLVSSTSTGEGMVDPVTNLHYDNMLYAQVDAVIFAVTRMGYGRLEVRVSETGWPSKGDVNEVGATIENAGIYNRNLLRRQMGNEGTPLRPNQRLEVYLFALFNENMKPGQTSERNYGLYEPDMTMTYNVGLSALSPDQGTTASSDQGTSASVSLTSSAIAKGARKGHKSLGYWSLICLLTFQVLMRRPA